ncbi:MAG: radical SAM protein [Elusimicrobia bacterium]|nr:radical SAM protein [Elusimicrobiota bacterium]
MIADILPAAELQQRNTDLNNQEYLQRKTVLASTPQRIFMQINAICNADCVFCSKGYDYPTFSLDDYLKMSGAEMTPIIASARELVLTGSGEFLGLPDAERILTYFNENFRHVDKYIATNASHSRPRIWELLAAPESRYTLQLSLHSTDKESHELMMRYGSYDQVMRNLDYLLEARRKTGSPKINLMFIMTTLNAEKLPEFIRWGAKLGVDKIIAGYFYIYESQQKYLSLYFKQELANRVIDEAREAAAEAKCEVVLPPKFGDSPSAYVRPECCPEPWHQIMINADGRVLPCDVYGNFNEDLTNKSFTEIWNGPAYQEIRRLLAKNEGCIKTCPRQNVAAINDWRAHVISRHKDDKQIVKEYHEALRKP